MITIFTDGSSRGNPGPGGWGTLIVKSARAAARIGDDKLKVQSDENRNLVTDLVVELGGGEKNTTNNRMELKAVIEGLENDQCSITNDQVDHKITVYTDSSYLINGITKWIQGWKRNGWKTKTKDDVLNKDLWMDLDEALNKVGAGNVSWKYVGGHVGIAGNERCDEIATGFADGTEVALYNGPFSAYSNQKILDISHDAEKVKSKKSSSSKSKAKAYSYISSIGGETQIHKTWAECEKRVKGAKGARYKKSLDAMNEAEIVDEFSKN